MIAGLVPKIKEWVTWMIYWNGHTFDIDNKEFYSCNDDIYHIELDLTAQQVNSFSWDVIVHWWGRKHCWQEWGQGWRGGRALGWRTCPPAIHRLQRAAPPEKWSRAAPPGRWSWGSSGLPALHHLDFNQKEQLRGLGQPLDDHITFVETARIVLSPLPLLKQQGLFCPHWPTNSCLWCAGSTSPSWQESWIVIESQSFCHQYLGSEHNIPSHLVFSEWQRTSSLVIHREAASACFSNKVTGWLSGLLAKTNKTACLMHCWLQLIEFVTFTLSVNVRMFSSKVYLSQEGQYCGLLMSLSLSAWRCWFVWGACPLWLVTQASPGPLTPQSPQSQAAEQWEE